MPFASWLRSRKSHLALLALASLVLLVPVLIAPVPPITDYPNHLARMWLLSGGEQIASVTNMYRIRFDTTTNIAIDLIALTVGRLTSWTVAGRLSVALAVLLPPLGGALFWRSIHGRWHWWMLSFGLLAWGQNLLSALLNFQIGIGLALLFAAIEPSLDGRSAVVKVTARSLMSVLLLLAHPFGLLFYAFLLTGRTLGARIAPASASWRRGVLTALPLAAFSLVLVVLAFLLATPSLPGAQEHSGLNTLALEFHQGLQQVAANPIGKSLKTFIAIRSYSNRLDLATGIVFMLPLLVAAWQRRLAVHAGLALMSAALLLCFALCPDYLLGAYWVDTRFSVMLPFALFAALRPEPTGRRATLCAAVLTLAFIGRTAAIGTIWRDRQADVASLADALAALPPGAALLPLEQRPLNHALAPVGRYTAVGENSFHHLPALALPWRHAFVPTLFAARGKQPVQVLPPFDATAEPNGGQLADVHVLEPGAPDRFELAGASYALQWQRRFDYILVVNADLPDRHGPFQPPPELELVRDAGFAKLYRIVQKH